jgi:periplasmic protein CpxP/Spy
MKSLHALLLILFIACTVTLSAQPQQRGERMIQRLKDSLSLSQEQVTKIKAILDKQQEEGKKDWDANQGDRDAMRTLMMKRMEKSDVEIEKILTKEQKKKYQEIKKQRQDRMRERMD